MLFYREQPEHDSPVDSYWKLNLKLEIMGVHFKQGVRDSEQNRLRLR